MCVRSSEWGNLLGMCVRRRERVPSSRVQYEIVCILSVSSLCCYILKAPSYLVSPFSFFRVSCSGVSWCCFVKHSNVKRHRRFWIIGWAYFLHVMWGFALFILVHIYMTGLISWIRLNIKQMVGFASLSP